MNAESRSVSGISRMQPEEVRVLGCLLEKQRTTPDMYPLTLNGLRLACNQSTSRDPVVDYDNDVIRDALHRLERRGFARLASGQGSRAPKYRHLLADALPMGPDEQAVMCVLMLRGPQTPGELKQRVGRMHTFSSIEALHDTLGALSGRGLVERLPRRPGQKEERYAHLLEGSEDEDSQTAGFERSPQATAVEHAEPPAPQPIATVPEELPRWASVLHERVATLEREVAELREAPWPAASGDDLYRVGS